MASPWRPSPNKHLQDTHYILRAPSCLPVSPLSFFFPPPRVHYLHKLSLSLGRRHILSGRPGVFNFTACACVCSAGTFFVAFESVTFLRRTAIKQRFPFLPASAHPSLFSSFQRISHYICSSRPCGCSPCLLSSLSCPSFLLS